MYAKGAATTSAALENAWRVLAKGRRAMLPQWLYRYLAGSWQTYAGIHKAPSLTSSAPDP